VNLHLGPAELARHLVECVERGDVLDAFLLAAGMHQIAEDVLEADRLRLADTHRVLTGGGHRVAATVVSRAASALAAVSRGRAGVRTHVAALAPLVDELAAQVMSGGATPPWLVRRARSIVHDLPSEAALQAGLVRLPACFRGFDQHPDDVVRMAAEFAAGRPDRETPIAVVGVRTSGSYLAPLTAAALRADGYAQATALTVRPSHPLDARKRRLLRDVVRGGGVVIVNDDPPASGDSIARVCSALRSLGATRAAIVPMFATHAGAGAPDALGEYACITLPWGSWSVHERLAPGAVARSRAQLWPGESIGEVTRVPLADTHARGHVAARYRVAVEGPEPEVRDVFVRGAGLGYLGRHAIAVADRLDSWVPHIHGVTDGLMFRTWLPAESAVSASETDVAEYVAARARRLAVDQDATDRLAGQDPVWEVASNILSRAFARGWRAMRIASLDAIARELLRARRPCVVDGRMDPSLWFEGRVKAKADERAFSNRNLACCDAAYDVAAAAALGELDPALLRAEFARVSGDSIDGERWLILQLVAAWAARRDGVLSEAAEGRASARALRRYLADLFLDDVPRGAGGFCALDLDGVLETETLGFPGPSPAGALALRALLAHGFRPLLASGRSIGEVSDRCCDYGLAGGVGEYGAAVFDGASGEVQVLVSPAGAAAVERAREALAQRPGVEVGTDHAHTIRAWRRDEGRRSVPLLEGDIRAALDAAGPGALRTVPGESQTDLVPNEVDKLRGLRALTGAPLHMAVGDAVEDLPMLRAASLAIAPANADAAVRGSETRIARRAYQRGLAAAVAELIGHAPGGCPTCAVDRHSRRTDLVLGVLGARERGPAGLAMQALRTTWSARAAR
jgi:hypothetical protein